MPSLKEISQELVVKFGNQEPTRSPNWTEDNPIGLEQKDAIAIAKELNSHQASMFVLFHQYQKHQKQKDEEKFKEHIERKETLMAV